MRGSRASARTAQQLEEAGWDGFLVVDSQNLSGDPYVALAMAATGLRVHFLRKEDIFFVGSIRFTIILNIGDSVDFSTYKRKFCLPSSLVDELVLNLQ